MSIELYILILISYLLGSIPFGLIISKLNGVDIRLHGSKNIGATNVLRVLGKKYGLTTFFLDTLKGFIPTYYFPMFLIENQFSDIGILFGILSIIGHTFPIFLAFKGGKGVATSAGMLFGVAPIALFIGFLIWILTLMISKYVSLSSILACITALLIVLFDQSSSLILQVLMFFLTVLIIFLHRANIARIINGTENKIKRE